MLHRNIKLLILKQNYVSCNVLHCIFNNMFNNQVFQRTQSRKCFCYVENNKYEFFYSVSCFGGCTRPIGGGGSNEKNRLALISYITLNFIY